MPKEKINPALIVGIAGAAGLLVYLMSKRGQQSGEGENKVAPYLSSWWWYEMSKIDSTAPVYGAPGLPPGDSGSDHGNELPVIVNPTWEDFESAPPDVMIPAFPPGDYGDDGSIEPPPNPEGGLYYGEAKARPSFQRFSPAYVRIYPRRPARGGPSIPPLVR